MTDRAKKLVSKAEFARLAGVSRNTITVISKTILSEAVNDGRIDIEHPAAKKYLTHKAEIPTSTDLYTKALRHVGRTQDASPQNLVDAFDIPISRARQLLKQMEKAGKLSTTPRGPGAMRTVLIPPGDYPEPTPASKIKPKKTGKKKADPDPPATDGLPEYEPDRDIAHLFDFTLRDVLRKWGTDERFKHWLGAAKILEEVQFKQLKNAQTRGELISRELVSQHIFGLMDDVFRRMLTDEPRSLARRVYAMAKAGATIEEGETVIADALGKQLRAAKSNATRLLK